MEDMNKSIDTMIDELFAETEETVSKAADMIKDQKPQRETADEALAGVPKGEKDEARGAGRPKQISEIPQTDTDGKRSGEYDGSIASANSDTAKKEDSQVKVPDIMKKAVSDEEFAEYQALKKAKVEQDAAETMKKARQEQADLIKAVITDATAELRKENEELRKSLQETAGLVKSMANKPQSSKSITGIQAVEKFQKSQSNNTLSKSEILDIAEDLVKSKHLTMEHCIEIENSGFIYDKEARDVLEREVRRRYK